MTAGAPWIWIRKAAGACRRRRRPYLVSGCLRWGWWRPLSLAGSCWDSLCFFTGITCHLSFKMVPSSPRSQQFHQRWQEGAELPRPPSAFRGPHRGRRSALQAGCVHQVTPPARMSHSAHLLCPPAWLQVDIKEETYRLLVPFLVPTLAGRLVSRFPHQWGENHNRTSSFPACRAL